MANNRLRSRRVKTERQQNLYNILPLRRMAQDMPFPVHILDENCLSSRGASHLPVAGFKLDLAIQPNGKESTRRVMKVRFARSCRDVNKTNARGFVEGGTRGCVIGG